MNNSAYPHVSGEFSTLSIRRSPDGEWLAIDPEDRVVGRGGVSRRPGPRTFISIDAWTRSSFDEIAVGMLAELPGPLYTVVDASDGDLIDGWRRHGFAEHRREDLYRVPTEQLPRPGAPSGIEIRSDDAEAPTFHATVDGEPAGQLQLINLGRVPRIGTLSVREDHRRRGVATALLAEALASLRRDERPFAAIDVDASDVAVASLLAGFGADVLESNLEMARG